MTNRKYEVSPGECLKDAAREMVQIANATGEPVTATFNGIELSAKPGTTLREIADCFDEESARRSKAYRATPEYQEQQRQSKERDRRKKIDYQSAMFGTRAIRLRDPATWKKAEENNSDNSDPYGARIISYAKDWARLMQVRMDAGESLEQCAPPTREVADYDLISGFIYGAAVALLAKTWEHGDELRRWHNLKTQTRNEGEEANESGGTLNPALLCIGGAK